MRNKKGLIHSEVNWIPFIIVAIIIAVVIIIVLVQLESLECDIGEKEIVGDFIITGKFLSKNHIISDKDCAVRDCLAFNDYQKQTGDSGICVV